MKIFLRLSLLLVTTFSLSAIMFNTPVFAATDLDADAACKTTDSAKCVEKVPDPALNSDCRKDDDQCNPVTQYINPLINTLSAVVGIAVVIGIIIGGIEYASSGGDPQKAASGKGHIKTAIIALIAYFFLYAFLQFVIPGGILTT